MTADKTDKFMKAVKVIFANEGGYINHKDDPGGKTNMGITKDTLKNAVKCGITDINDVKKLTRSTCEDIYFEMYWTPCKAECMKDAISLIHFDGAVNCGITMACKLIQKTINKVLNSNILVIDGIIGKNTLNYLDKVSITDEMALKSALVYCDIRDNYYDELAINKPKMKVFLKGWHNRIQHLRDILNKGY